MTYQNGMLNSFGHPRSIFKAFIAAVTQFQLVISQLQRGRQSVEMRCYCTIPHNSDKDYVTSEEVCVKLEQALPAQTDLLMILESGKLPSYGHISQLALLARLNE